MAASGLSQLRILVPGSPEPKLRLEPRPPLPAGVAREKPSSGGESRRLSTPGDGKSSVRELAPAPLDALNTQMCVSIRNHAAGLSNRSGNLGRHPPLAGKPKAWRTQWIP